MKRIIFTRLHFLGRNMKQAGKLPHEEFLKLAELLPQYHHKERSSLIIDRTLLDLLFQLKQQYRNVTITLKPLLDEYKTLVDVMKQEKNYSSHVFRRYDDVLSMLQHSKTKADALILEMRHVKSYLDMPRLAAASHFIEESKTLFTAMQRDFVEFYEPMVGVAEGKTSRVKSS